MTLARQIIKMRLERGLSQRDMARQSGISCASIALWETGARPMTPKGRAKLAEFFGVPMRDLMPEYNEEPPKNGLVVTEPELIAFVASYRSLNTQARQAMLTAVQAVAMIQALQATNTLARS